MRVCDPRSHKLPTPTPTPTFSHPTSPQHTLQQGRWLPVESNPEVFNELAAKLGWPVDAFCFQDLLSLDEWATAMVPRPVLGVAMLYNIVPAQEAHREAEEAARAAAPAPPAPGKGGPLFITQDAALPNACGTIALVHACANASAPLGGPVALPEGAWLRAFAERALARTSVERAAMLSSDPALESKHNEAVAGGQSAVVDETWGHFVCFVNVNGRLWELDGRKGGPIDHGASDPAALLEAAGAVMREYMARDPESIRFTLLALAPPPPADD